MLGERLGHAVRGVTATRDFGPYRIYRINAPRQRRILQLLTGLVVFGFALGISVEAMLGVNPWTVFHGGLSARLPISIGLAIVLVGLLLLLTFPFIDEPIGLGTALNVAVIGFVVDLTLWIVPDLESMVARVVAIAIAPILIGLGSGLYIGAGLGPGPRDGVMTALERRGIPVWLARTGIELSALTIGVILGGDAGWGTLWMAGSVGFWVQFFLKRLRIDRIEA